MNSRFPVILSQGHSQNPAKRSLEDGILSALQQDDRLAVVVVANLYDLGQDGPGATALRQITGDMVVLSWMYPRSAHWVLDQYGIDGQVGATALAGAEDETGNESQITQSDENERVIASRQIRSRNIYCLDLRSHDSAQPYVDEIRRIVEGSEDADYSVHETALVHIDERVGRRWYPVIDFSRCINCMECVDFCLFGVYGIDEAETILVEQPDNCRKGCPACSRVCPENAIIFPQHKAPAIAGALDDKSGLKIDLSKLFGAPEGGGEASTAARERDEQLLLAGQNPAGSSATNQGPTSKTQRPKDELDELIDELDELDL